MVDEVSEHETPQQPYGHHRGAQVRGKDGPVNANPSLLQRNYVSGHVALRLNIYSRSLYANVSTMKDKDLLVH